MIRFAIIGTNFITDWFIEAAARVPEFCFYSIYSRDENRAVAFGENMVLIGFILNWRI